MLAISLRRLPLIKLVDEPPVKAEADELETYTRLAAVVITPWVSVRVLSTSKSSCKVVPPAPFKVTLYSKLPLVCIF